MTNNKNSNNMVWGIIAATVILCATIFGIAWMLLKETRSYTEPYINNINVDATATRDVEPDEAMLYFSVEVRGDDKAEVAESLESSTNLLKSALLEDGVEEGNVKTNNFNIYPDYDYNYETGEETENGFRANHSLTATVTDLSDDAVNRIITDTIGLENVSYNNVQFRYENEEEVKNELRAEAVQKAKAKAEALVQETDKNLGELVNIRDSYSGGYYPEPYYKGGVYLDDMAATESVGEFVSPGSSEIRVDVSLEYKLK